MSAYMPKTGERCTCRRGIERDNCPTCEGTGQKIDFAAIRRRALRAKVNQEFNEGLRKIFEEGAHE